MGGQHTYRDASTDPAGVRIPEGRRWFAVLFTMAFPSLLTWVYFVALSGHAAMRPAYGLGKALQFAAPLFFVFGVSGIFGMRPRMPAPCIEADRSRGWGVAWGAVFGAVVAAAMFAAYFGFLKGTPALAGAPEAVLAKLRQIGAATPMRFLALASFYSLIHSFLEEYYWRWFVFGQLRALISPRAAIALSSLAFMAHHVIIIGLYFGRIWWLTVLLSAAVAVGGAVWAWIYQRSGSLAGPWLSHVLLDAAIMTIGFDMIR